MPDVITATERVVELVVLVFVVLLGVSERGRVRVLGANPGVHVAVASDPLHLRAQPVARIGHIEPRLVLVDPEGGVAGIEEQGV